MGSRFRPMTMHVPTPMRSKTTQWSAVETISWVMPILRVGINRSAHIVCVTNHGSYTLISPHLVPNRRPKKCRDRAGAEAHIEVGSLRVID